MPRESVRHAIGDRLLLGIGFTVVLSALMTTAVFLVSASAMDTLERRVTEIDRMTTAQHTLEVSLSTQEAFIFDFALSERIGAVQEFDAATQDALLAYGDLREVAVDFPELRDAVEAVHETSDRWRKRWAEPFIRSVEDSGRPQGAAAVVASDVLFRPAEASIEALKDVLATLRLRSAEEASQAVPSLAAVVVPLGVGVTLLLALLGAWLTRSISGPLLRLNRTAQALVRGEPVSFKAEREDEVGALAEILEQMRRDVGVRYEAAHRDGEHAATFNQLAQLTSFASDEQELVQAAVHALRRLVPAERGDILLANPSQNRLTVSTAWGEGAPEAGKLVQVEGIDRCPGIRRSSAFVARDVADDMAVRCPAHPALVGTVACVPMSALGKMVGVIHLEQSEAGAFTPEMMQLVARVAESVGLAMANARLMRTMEGQAMSDALTGLRNARFFDPYLEQELENAQRDQQSTSVIMLDLDHFKTFNDTYGHPAGDEALRTFARVLSATIRSSDVAARYGGEEFVVALRHAPIDDARRIAEKIRLAIEQMVVELGPGRYGRITASLGVASTEAHVHDMKSLVALADAALYRAKESGRNRVEVAPTAERVTALSAASRRRHGPATPDQAAASA